MPYDMWATPYPFDSFPDTQFGDVSLGIPYAQRSTFSGE